MQPIHIPEEWHDDALLTFDQFCELSDTPARTARGWRRSRVGPEWCRFEGCGRLYITVAEVRRCVKRRLSQRARCRVQPVSGEAAVTEPSVVVDDSRHRDLLTPAQLADRWGVTTGHLANLRTHGEGIGYLKIGSRVAYRYSDVVAFETEHYVSPGTAL